MASLLMFTLISQKEDRNPQRGPKHHSEKTPSYMKSVLQCKSGSPVEQMRNFCEEVVIKYLIFKSLFCSMKDFGWNANIAIIFLP